MYRMWPRKGQEAGLYFTIRAFLIFPMFGFMFYTSMCHLGFNIYCKKFAILTYNVTVFLFVIYTFQNILTIYFQIINLWK